MRQDSESLGQDLKRSRKLPRIFEGIKQSHQGISIERLDPVFPGIYVSTYSVLIPKGSDESEIEEAKKEAVEIISKFEEIEYSFVDMREKRAAEAERQIRKNIVDIER